MIRNRGKNPGETRKLWFSSEYGLLPLLWKIPIWIIRGTISIRLLWWRQARNLIRSGTFDPEAYLRRFPQVRQAEIDPIYHYVRFGVLDDASSSTSDGARMPHSEHTSESRSSEPKSTSPDGMTGAHRVDAAEERRDASALSDADLRDASDGWQLNQRQLQRRSAGPCTPLLFVSHDAARAGAQIYLLEVLKSFSRRPDLELYVLLLGRGVLEEAFQNEAHVFQIQDLTDHGDSEEDAILKALDGMAAPPRSALANTVASSRAAKLLAGRGHTVVSIIHELPTTIESLGSETIYEIVEASHRVIVVSEFVKHRLIAAYELPSSSLEVVYVGVTGWKPGSEGDPSKAREEIFDRHGIPRDSLLVLGCGSVHQRKGPDLFVQAAVSALRDYEVQNVHFLWVGGDQSGPLARLWCEHDAEILGLSDRIYFVGQQESTLEYYQAADVFLLTSREDPFPLVNLEALARGLPIVAFGDAGGASEALEGGAGVIVPYLDVPAMTRALVRFIEAPRHRAEISRNAQARAQERFRWERFIDDLTEILLPSTEEPGNSTDDRGGDSVPNELVLKSMPQSDSLRSLLTFMRNQGDEFWIWCLTEGRNNHARLDQLLPSLPDPEVQQRFTGLSGKRAFEQSAGFKQVCEQQILAKGGELSPSSRILDFGCGWGRITLTLLNSVEPDNIISVDIDEEAIQSCRQRGIPVDFRTIPPAPPVDFPDSHFDCIVSFSVFSHLDEEYFLAWTREFHRILKPGGTACLTTRPRQQIQWFKELRESGDVPFFARGGAQSFVDSEAAFRDYDAGLFCFAPEDTPHIGKFYGEACIPLGFLEEHLAEAFDQVDLIPFDSHGLFDQNLIVLRK